MHVHDKQIHCCEGQSEDLNVFCIFWVRTYPGEPVVVELSSRGVNEGLHKGDQVCLYVGGM